MFSEKDRCKREGEVLRNESREVRERTTVWQ